MPLLPQHAVELPLLVALEEAKSSENIVSCDDVLAFDAQKERPAEKDIEEGLVYVGVEEVPQELSAPVDEDLLGFAKAEEMDQVFQSILNSLIIKK